MTEESMSDDAAAVAESEFAAAMLQQLDGKPLDEAFRVTLWLLLTVLAQFGPERAYAIDTVTAAIASTNPTNEEVQPKSN